MSERAFNLFGLNAPSWTLFWEYVANIMYALFLNRLKKQWLLILAIIVGAIFLYNIIDFGNASGGWGKSTYWHGLPRMFFSFLIGMCIWRFQWLIKNRLNFISLGLLLSLSFIFPYRDEWNIISEAMIIMVYFPLLVALGAGTIHGDKFLKVSRFSGKYLIHYI